MEVWAKECMKNQVFELFALRDSAATQDMSAVCQEKLTKNIKVKRLPPLQNHDFSKCFI